MIYIKKNTPMKYSVIYFAQIIIFHHRHSSAKSSRHCLLLCGYHCETTYNVSCVSLISYSSTTRTKNISGTDMKNTSMPFYLLNEEIKYYKAQPKICSNLNFLSINKFVESNIVVFRSFISWFHFLVNRFL